MAEIITSEGDVLDGICHRFYGRVDSNILKEVLEANQNIGDNGLVFEAGVTIILPDEITTQEVIAVRKLWD